MRARRASSVALVCGWLWLAGSAAGQDISYSAKTPSVTYAQPEELNVAAGKSGDVSLKFRVVSGFHINSNQPKSEYLIPTALTLEAPTNIAIAKITYPAGEDMSFPFSPDEKLNVYTGDFAVELAVHPLRTVAAGEYAVHGTLKYQACDNSACYPPKKLPVEFKVKVTK
jgi:hypothetical protein